MYALCPTSDYDDDVDVLFVKVGNRSFDEHIYVDDYPQNWRVLNKWDD